MFMTTEVLAGTVIAELLTSQTSFLPKSALESVRATLLLAAPVPFSWAMRHFWVSVNSRVPFHQVICRIKEEKED